MLNASTPNTAASSESGFFKQIAMLSAAGLAMSVALALIGGGEMLLPWL
jgi:hypothetical protein